jgi:hypothetical protein
MATTTPNYGWTVPTSTDLVKDGATAIETLGDAIDASMNTALGTKKAGMVLLNTTSFSAVSSQSLPTGTFSATYEFYKIVYAGVATGDVGMSGRLRASGSDNSTSNYSMTGTYTNNAVGPSRTNSAGANAWEIGSAGVNGFSLELDLYWPFDTSYKTTYIGHAFANYAGDRQNAVYGGQFNATTQFDSFSFFPTSGTITGEVTVYGYNR